MAKSSFTNGAADGTVIGLPAGDEPNINYTYEQPVNKWHGQLDQTPPALDLAVDGRSLTGWASVNGFDTFKEIKTSDLGMVDNQTLIIPSTWWIWSDNTGVAALTVDTPGAIIENHGKIIGRGGDGGNTEGAVGGNGGPGISITADDVTINNESGAYIAGGGGGGGAGQGDEWGGGGGGAGGGKGGRGTNNGSPSGGQSAGGTLNQNGGNGSLTMGVASWSVSSTGGGAGGGGGYGWGSDQAGSAGAGGRVLPGSAGLGGGRGGYNAVYGGYGGAGSSVGNGGTDDPYHGHASTGGGGGGGWGAAGGNGAKPSGLAHGSYATGNGAAGGSGGAAVSAGSPYTMNNSGTVYGVT